MTLDQLAEKYDMARNSIIYRRKHGIPLDAPKAPGNRKPRAAVIPKGTAPTTLSACGHRHFINCRQCPECGVTTLRGLKRTGP